MNKCLIGSVWISIYFLFFIALLSNCSGFTPTSPTISSVLITSTVLNPASGSKTNIAVNVYGTGEFSKVVTWSTVPNLGGFSAASEQGVIYTAPNVSAETPVTIRATSVDDSSKFGDLILTIKQAIPPSLRTSPTWAAYGEQVTANIAGMELSSLTLKLIDPTTNQSASLTPTIVSNKVLFSVPSNLQVSGGPKRLEVSDGLITLNSTLNVLGDVNSTMVVLSIKPEFSKEQVKTKLETLGLTLQSDGFFPLNGSSGVCSDTLALVELNGKPLGQTLEMLKVQDFVRFADPEALWKADPETLWDRGNFGLGGQYIQEAVFENPDTRFNAGENVTVAVLDTGISDFRQELQGNIYAGIDFTGEGLDDLFNLSIFSKDEVVNKYHGSWVAMMAVGSTLGIAQKARVKSIKVCDSRGTCRGSRVIRGLCYAINLGYQSPEKIVLNLSFGGDTPVYTIQAILKQALSSNIAIAAAVGNEPENASINQAVSELHYPASFALSNEMNGLLTVGAIQRVSDKVWSRSLTSRRGNHVDVAAPGVIIFANDPADKNTRGTSFATGVASGVLAALWASCPDLSAIKLESKLKQLARLETIDSSDQTLDKVGKGMVHIPTTLDCGI